MSSDGDRFAELLEHRRWIDSCKQSASRDRDKTTLMLAGGSMAISVGFLERVVPVMAQSWNMLLFSAWVLEIVAMLTILWSMKSSEAAFEAELYRTDHLLRSPGHEDPGWPNPSLKKTESLNSFAHIIAVIGLVFMLLHAGIALNSFTNSKEKPNVELEEHRHHPYGLSSNDSRPDPTRAAAGSSTTHQEVTAVFSARRAK